MSYSPTPGSDIAEVYNCITDKPQSIPTILVKLQTKNRKFPTNSISVHLRYLIKKGLVDKTVNGYLRNNFKPDNKPRSKSLQLLLYCKSKIGKKVNSREMIDSCCNGNIKDTVPATILKQLSLMGVVNRIEGTRPLEYLVLPEIKTIDKISYSKDLTLPKQETIHKIEPNDNIADLSIGQILTEYVALKDENRRLRDALQRIAHELYQVGEVET